MLSLFQAPGSKTVVQSSVKSDAKNSWGLGRERTATAPFPKSRASYVFSLWLLYFRDFPRSLAQATLCKSLTQAFSLPPHLWGRRKYNSLKNACVRRSRHALMFLHGIRENEKSTHFCSKLRAKNGFYFSVLFDFCCLFTSVWTSCIVLSFPPFAL